MKTPLFDRARFHARIAGYSISLLLGVAAFVYTDSLLPRIPNREPAASIK